MLRFLPLQSDDSASGFVLDDASVPGGTEGSVLLDNRTLAVLGWTSEMLPASGAITFGDEAGTRGQWRSVAWHEQDLGGRQYTRFFALIGFDDIGFLHAGPIRIVAVGDGPTVTLPPVGRVDIDAGTVLSRICTPRLLAANVFDFLRETTKEPPFADCDGAHAFMEKLLRTTSQQNGFIEILARPGCNGILFQGWSLALTAGIHTLLFDDGELSAFEAVVGTFARTDLLDSAHGVIAYFKDAREDRNLGLKRIYLRTDDGYGHLDLVENPVRIEAADVIPHLRHMMSTITCDRVVERAFKRICRPRFEGVDTLETLSAPVRFALDRILHVPGTGFLLYGWMLDPRHLVRMALFKSTGNFYSRLHESWHRIPRQDVTQGFMADPAFAPLLRRGEDMHGFIVFVPRAEPVDDDEAFYIELVLEDETCAFLPAAISQPRSDAEIRDILSAVDIDDPTFDRLVSQHLGPALSAVLSSRDAPDQAFSTITLGEPVPHSTVSVVMPVDGDGTDIDINLARFAGDADFESVEFVFIASRSTAGPVARRLRGAMAFYGLHGRLVVAPHRLAYFESLNLGSRYARTPLMLFLSATVLPDEPGWLRGLIDHLSVRPDAIAVSPTLLYEDFSIRYAGHPPEDSPLSAGRASRFAGYPIHWLREKRVQQARIIAAECCLVRREDFLSFGGFSCEFMEPQFQATDFALRTAKEGRACLWTPTISLFALDGDSESDTEYWVRTARRIDEWHFASKWVQNRERQIITKGAVP